MTLSSLSTWKGLRRTPPMPSTASCSVPRTGTGYYTRPEEVVDRNLDRNGEVSSLGLYEIAPLPRNL